LDSAHANAYIHSPAHPNPHADSDTHRDANHDGDGDGNDDALADPDLNRPPHLYSYPPGPRHAPSGKDADLACPLSLVCVERAQVGASCRSFIGTFRLCLPRLYPRVVDWICVVPPAAQTTRAAKID
jgi:hypothetical protein